VKEDSEPQPRELGLNLSWGIRQEKAPSTRQDPYPFDQGGVPPDELQDDTTKGPTSEGEDTPDPDPRDPVALGFEAKRFPLGHDLPPLSVGRNLPTQVSDPPGQEDGSDPLAIQSQECRDPKRFRCAGFGDGLAEREPLRAAGCRVRGFRLRGTGCGPEVGEPPKHRIPLSAVRAAEMPRQHSPLLRLITPENQPKIRAAPGADQAIGQEEVHGRGAGKGAGRGARRGSSIP